MAPRPVPKSAGRPPVQRGPCVGLGEVFAVVEHAELAGDALSFCARIGVSPEKRACLAVDLATGVYSDLPVQLPPKNFYDDPPVGIPASPEAPPVFRMSHGGVYSLATSNLAVRMCKGFTADCTQFPLANFRPQDLGERFGGARIPADVSKDGQTVALVRHEAGKGRRIFGELYNPWKGFKTARFPIETEGVVKDVRWLGSSYVFFLACLDDAPRCEGKVYDPKTEKLMSIEGLNFCCTMHEMVLPAHGDPGKSPTGGDPGKSPTGGDSWVFFDGAGNSAVWKDLKSGVVERRVVLRDPPLYAEGVAIGQRNTSSEAYVLYAGAQIGDVAIVNLESGEVKTRYAAPRCSKE